MDEKRLQEIEERAAKATPGPWVRVGGIPSVDTNAAYSSLNEHRILHNPDGSILGEFLGICQAPEFDANWEEAWQDLDFIAQSRQDIPDLLAEVKRLREERAELIAQNALLSEFIWAANYQEE